MQDFAEKDPSNLLMQKSDGKFVEMGEVAGIVSFAQARGAALADFNLDGAIDILVVNRKRPARIWRNDTQNIGHFHRGQGERGRPESRRNRRLDRGPLRRSRPAARAPIGGGHAGGQLTWAHFGLGADRQADVRVLCRDGEAGEWQKGRRRRFLFLERGRAPERWTPKE